jgi:pimeloyl-ACP methyl ester carboxylesterase
MQRIARHTIIVDGMPIIYETVGEGEPVILVHGLSGSTRWWRRNLPELSTRYRLYLIDLPGFGAMRRYSKHFHLIQAAAWLDAWVQAVGLETFHLVGHSMGGYVCMGLAVLHPEKVKRLVLVSSIGIPFEPTVVRMLPHLLRGIWRTTPVFWPTVISDGLRAGIPMVWNAASQIVALDALPVLTALNSPTLLIWGERDDLVPLSLARCLHKQLEHTQARLLVIKQANHVCMFEQPRQFNAALLAFFANQESDAVAAIE